MKIQLLCFLFSSVLFSCSIENPGGETPSIPQDGAKVVTSKLATFGSGCFWCGEAIFEQLRGVSEVVSGYSGGHVASPTYEEICGKETGHAEVFQVTYDPNIITYKDLLEVFWKTHDPTTLNSQGNDHGPQYRSVIFHHDGEQRELARGYLEKLDQSGAFDAPIVTTVVPFEKLWAAEAHHQDYYRRNQNTGYCQAVIVPKLLKFQSVFRAKLTR